MSKSIFGNKNIGLLLVFVMCGLTRADDGAPQPPMVLWKRESQGMIIVLEKERSNYNITCTANGVPKPMFQWLKNDMAIRTDDNVKNYDNGTLLFKYFSRDNDGMYQCKASNQYGTSMSPKIQVIFQVNPTKGEYSGTEDIEAVTGQDVTFKCADTPPTFPRHIKRWYSTEGTHEVIMNERIGTDSEGSLRFTHVVEDDSKDYICSLVPEIAESSVNTESYNKVTLRVLKTSGPAIVSPTLAFKSGNGYVKATVGSRATLECFFSANPTANITWKNNKNNPITELSKRFKLTDYNRKLVIDQVIQDDEGSFYCTASNGYGEITNSIMINVTSPPIKVSNQGLMRLIKPEQSDVTLMCQAKAMDAESLNKPVWFRNGEFLKPDNLVDPIRYSFNSDYTQLTIRNINKDTDTACYQCNVTNSEGYAFYDGSLLVIESIVIIKKPNLIEELEANGVIDISVIATGDMCCRISKTWYHNNISLSNDDKQTPPLQFNIETDTLLFNTTGLPDSVVNPRLGHYSVVVTNFHQNVTVEFTISMKGAVSREVAGAVVFELWWLAIILGLLVIIIAILIVVCCAKRRYPRATYDVGKTEINHNIDSKQELLDHSFQEI